MVRGNLKGYFTVEAASVLPFTIAAIVTVVYLTIYQYDRCIMEQDLLQLSIYATSMRGEEDKGERVQRKVEDVDVTQYLNCDLECFQVKMAGNSVESELSGSFLFPILGWNWFTDQNGWKLDTICIMKSFSPEKILRVKRKMKEVLKNED